MSQPDGLKSTNALDGFDLDNPPAELRLAGKILCVVANPPQLGENIELMIRVHIVEDCIAIRGDESEVRYLKAKLLAAWRPGDPPRIGTGGDLWDQAGPVGSTTPDEPPPQ